MKIIEIIIVFALEWAASAIVFLSLRRLKDTPIKPKNKKRK